jgi:exopolyphosphatase/guanosine-5'-triphosphate,3'-diphosphate pyrophosphatase
MSQPGSDSFAAVDLGSNSFHMVVATYTDGHLQIIDRIKDMVRLASGLDEKRNLTQDSMDRAIQCLERFGQRIGEVPRSHVRAVGTNTLRQARNGAAFLARARKALGHPIEIIAGREEARLIYLGVSHSIYGPGERRLVIDIGGGSTELIIGRGFEPRLMESLYMGCVNMSEQYFSGGEISAKRMRRAMLFAHQELESIETTYQKAGWDAVIGASGTIQAINDAIRARGWGDGGISADGLRRLREFVVETGDVKKLVLEGVSDRRMPVFVGGVAILSAVFEALQVEMMLISDGALREGLLYELIGRAQDQDTRDQTINELALRYGVDGEQAKRVATTAGRLFKQVQGSWQLDARTDRKLLEWAAQLHEIGLAVAHAQHHHHGGYLLTHSDMAGFSRQEQRDLAVLVRLHRRKFDAAELAGMSDDERERLQRLCVLLRLAVVLNRSRSSAALPVVNASAEKNRITLRFPSTFLAEHPLTLADLEGEQEMMRAAGMELAFE